MAESLVAVSRTGGVTRITLTRPQKRNALTRALLAELLAAVRGVQAQGTARVCVLAAEGPVFCAGMDLGEMQATAADPDAAALWRRDSELYRTLVGELFALSCPTIAAVQGPAVAGGVGLVLACDIVVAADAATFALPEPQRGITAAIVTPLLAYRLGAGGAGYLLLSGQTVDAAAALGMGLVHEVVGGDALGTRTESMCDAILAASPAALAASKRHLIACAGELLPRQLDASVKASAAARETPDAREGLAAFLERRKPIWPPATDHAP